MSQRVLIKQFKCDIYIYIYIYIYLRQTLRSTATTLIGHGAQTFTKAQLKAFGALGSLCLPGMHMMAYVHELMVYKSTSHKKTSEEVPHARGLSFEPLTKKRKVLTMLAQTITSEECIEHMRQLER